MRKELLFGFSIMALVVLATIIFMPWGNIESGHMGLLMLSLVVWQLCWVSPLPLP